MLSKGHNCKGCVLEQIGTGFARTDGLNKLGVMCVAEALGEEEAHEGKPLVGRAGKLFNRMVARTFDDTLGRNLAREDFLLGNVMQCRPPNNELVGAWYEHQAIEHCKPYLNDTLTSARPKVVLAMGNTPLRWFTGQTGIEQWRGYVVETQYGWVVPTYHPSYLLRGNLRLCKVFINDLKKAINIARHGWNPKPVKYLLDPTPEVAMEWANAFHQALRGGEKVSLSFDIETPYSGGLDEDQVIEDDVSYIIERISFSYREGEAISFQWTPPFIQIAQQLLSSECDKVVYNRDFDVPRVEANGCPVLGRIYDAMWAWHKYQPEWPYGLKYAATFCTDLPQWKHKSKDSPAYYNATDSDAALRVYNFTRREMEKDGRWPAFERHVVDVGMVLAKMSKRGVLVDPQKRMAERVRFQERYNVVCGELNKLVPEEVKTLHPKGKKGGTPGYKKTEEQLRKAGLWVEGEMVCVGVMDVKEPKPKKAKTPGKVPSGEARTRRKKKGQSAIGENGALGWKTETDG